jgi:2-methylthioadenine synthetase
VAGEILKDKVFKPSFSSGDRTRSFLKIQDGCDYFCSYCTIPLARGTSRSDTVANTVEQATLAAQKGAKEIILTGVNIGDFGRRNGENFHQLIQALETVEGIERYRISSIEPNLLTDEIIEFVASSRLFMPHFHIPIQSGCNEVLKLMKRKYNRVTFCIPRQPYQGVIPHAFIGVDVIVGVNGETEAHFQETLDFLTGIEASQLHVFTYSERPNTQALKIEGKVPLRERQRRSHLLLELSEQKRLEFYKQHLGLEAPVLFESTNYEGMIHGFTHNYIKVEVPFNSELVNTIQTVVMKSLTFDKQAIHAEIKSQP